jgi:predicted RNA-binding protein with PUA-like domain
MKSEGSCYPISQLKKDKKTLWSGVRNYQARNYMLGMHVGDKVLFYHSDSKPNGVYGLAQVCAVAVPDITAQDPTDEHYDPKASKAKPIWSCVTVEYVDTFAKPVTLQDMRTTAELKDMKLLQKGSRLSVISVSKAEYDIICKMS